MKRPCLISLKIGTSLDSDLHTNPLTTKTFSPNHLQLFIPTNVINDDDDDEALSDIITLTTAASLLRLAHLHSLHKSY